MLAFPLACGVCYFHVDGTSGLRCWCDALSQHERTACVLRAHALSSRALAPNPELSEEHMVPKRSSLYC